MIVTYDYIIYILGYTNKIEYIKAATTILISNISDITQEEKIGRSDFGPTLTSWVQTQQRRHPGTLLSLVVIDIEQYFR